MRIAQRCPACGNRTLITDYNEDADGDVVPTAFCTRPGCTYGY